MQWTKGRMGQNSRIEKLVPNWHEGPRIMIHTASYGEYEMSIPIISELQKTIPELNCIISFYSPSGYENVTFSDSKFVKIYLPLDTISNQRKLIELIRPDAVIFIKYEFWYNLLRVLSGNNSKSIAIPYYYTSINIPEDSYLWNPLAKSLLNLIKNGRLWCHNETNMAFLKNRGIEKLELLGDTRIDKVIKNVSTHNHPILFDNTDNVKIIFGSLCPEDLDMAVDYINNNQEYNYAIAPHDVEESFVKEIRNRLKISSVLYSRMITESDNHNLVIIDTLGDLKFLYKGFDIAYVGGGFSKGPHNLLEPLIYGTKIICGSNIIKFPLAQDLQKKGLLLVMNKQMELETYIDEAINTDENLFIQKKEAYIQDNKSRLPQLIKELKQLLNPNPS